jgi:hypothetical protein
MSDVNYSSVSDVSKLIADELSKYSASVVEKIKISIDETGNEVVAELKEISPKRYGKYAKGWSSKTTFENQLEKRKTIYNKNYRLTHLLEYGHIKKDGGRTKAYNHIRKAEETAINKLTEQIKKAVENE